MAIALAIWAFVKRIPPWVYAVIAVILFGFYLEHHGAARIQDKWDKAKEVYAAEQAALKEANDAKISKALEDNKNLVLQHKATTNRITKEFDENKAYVSDLVYANKSLRGMLIGPSFSSPGATSEASTGGTTGSNGTSAAQRVLSERAAKDFEQLGLNAEHDAAIARACQDFLRSNGMTPKPK